MSTRDAAADSVGPTCDYCEAVIERRHGGTIRQPPDDLSSNRFQFAVLSEARPEDGPDRVSAKLWR